MWLQMSQILKKFTEGNARKLALIFTRDVTKIRKTRLVSRHTSYAGESKSKLEQLFYRLFRFFCHIFLALGLNTCLNRV